MKRGEISNLLRKLRLLYFTDWIRYNVQKFENRTINNQFKKENPEVKLPPDYLMYESFRLNYRKYFVEGRESAKSLINHFERHIELKNKVILDWGCGPGRIIRHFPFLIGNGCEFLGTDYNKNSIDWCSKNLPGIKFNNNSLKAELPYESNSIDVIYGLSIFTHLSEKMHHDWIDELFRILKPNGIMLLSTQGENFIPKMTDEEIEIFKQNKLVVRGNVKEGHRTYSAFHPKEFMKKLFSKLEILEHVENPPKNDKSFPQAIWIVKK